MYEEKRIKQVLIRNTILFFLVFALIFTVLGFFVFQMVNSNIFKSADAQLLGQGITNAIFVAEPIDFSTPEATKDPDETKDTQDDLSATPEIETAIGYLSQNPLVYERAVEEIPEDPNDSYNYIDETGTSYSLSQQFIDESAEDNPQTIYLFRNEKGELLDTYGVNSSFPEYLKTMPFDESQPFNVAYSITHEGHHFRTLITELDTSEGTYYYLQPVINVDSEIEILTRFTQTLVIGLLGALIACAAASYLLSRRTIRPIAEAWSKQTEFVQNASHELRTPLAVIQATQELLLEDPHAKIIDHFEDIAITQEESERLRVLAEGLLLLSASDSNKLPLEISEFSLDELVEETGQAFSAIAEENSKDITFALNYGKFLRADEQKVRQLINILLDNALKYTKEGDSISIITKEQNGMASLSVADTGIGISDEDLTRVFDRFFRADKARSRTNDGMGLGLSLARSITDAHRGDIEMSHNEPKGTIVKVLLPMRPNVSDN